MRVRTAHDVKALRLVEDLFVEVRRAVEQPDSLALLDLLAADRGVCLGRALEGCHRCCPPDDLIGRGSWALGAVELPLVGMVEEGKHAVRDRVPRGLVAGY